MRTTRRKTEKKKTETRNKTENEIKIVSAMEIQKERERDKLEKERNHSDKQRKKKKETEYGQLRVKFPWKKKHLATILRFHFKCGHPKREERVQNSFNDNKQSFY